MSNVERNIPEQVAEQMVEMGISDASGLQDDNLYGAKKPSSWPEKCGNCGAPWIHIYHDITDGFCCHRCGACDSNE